MFQAATLVHADKTPVDGSSVEPMFGNAARRLFVEAFSSFRRLLALVVMSQVLAIWGVISLGVQAQDDSLSAASYQPDLGIEGPIEATLNIQLPPESQYEILRISHLYDRYRSLRTDHETWLEEEFGLSGRVLRATASRLAWALAPDTLSLDGFACEGNVISAPVSAQGSVVMQDRLAVLSQSGRTVFWAVHDLADYATSLRDGAFTAEHKPAICHQVNKISTALECYFKSPGTCNAVVLQEALLEDFSDPAALPKVIVFNNRLKKMKATLSPVIDELLLLAGDPSSPLGQELAQVIALKTKAQQLSTSDYWVQSAEKLEPILRKEASRILMRGIAETMYRYYQETPEPFRHALEAYADLQNQAQLALQAAKTISDRKKEFEQAYQAADFAASRLRSDLVSLHDRQMISARQQIADFSVVAAYQVQSLIEAAETIETAINQAPSAAAKLAEELVRAELEGVVLQFTAEQCQAAQSYLSDSVVFSAQNWGREPSEELPFGYRYSASPTGQSRVIEGIQRKLYDVDLELLIHVPSVPLDNKLAEACPDLMFPGVKSLPLGLVIKDVYRTETPDPVTNSHFRIDGTSQLFKLIKDTRQLQESMETTGIPISWLGSDIRVTLQNFNDVSFTFNHPMLQLPVPFIADNEMVFKPADAALAVCHAASNKIIPSLLSRWAATVQLSADGWTVRSAVGANAVVRATCNNITELFQEGGGAPQSLDASLSVETNLILEGALEGREVRLAGTANLTVSPGNVAFKSAYLDETTSVLDALLQEKLDQAQAPWNLDNAEGLELKAQVGTINALDSIDAITVHAGIDVMYKGCAPLGLSAKMGLDGSFSVDAGAQDKVEDLLTCGVQTALNVLLQNQFDCDQVAADGVLFGGELGTVVVRDGAQNNSCRFDIRTADNGLAIEGVVARFDGSQIHFDLGNAYIHDEVVRPVIKERTRTIIGNLANNGIIVGDPRFTSAGLSVPVAIDVPAPVGRIDLGDVTIGVNGRLSMKTSIKDIVDSKLRQTLTPKLEAIARRRLPQEVRVPQIKIALRQGLSATAKVVIELDPDLPLIHGELSLLPSFSANIVWDVERMAKSEVETWLAGVLPLRVGPVRIDTPRFVQTLDNEVVLRTGLKMKLPKLGSIRARHIDITRDGVKINGRLEVRTGLALPLFATPPTYLVQPGVYYDLSQKEIGAIAGFTVIAPPFADVFRLDGSFSFGCAQGQLCQEDSSVSALKMEAAGIVLDVTPLIFARGEINFADLRVTFDAETLQLFHKLFDWRMTGLIDVRQTRVHLHTALRILEVDMGKLEILGNLKDCPSRCLTAKKNINLLIGKGLASTTFDLMGLDPRMGLGIDLRIFGRDIGGGELHAGLLFAKLDAQLLEVFKVKLATPSLKDMSPEYLADVIASLLRIKLKDVLNFLKKPDIRLAPVGSAGDVAGAPPSSDGGDDGGNGNDPGNEPGTGSPSGPSESEAPEGSAPGTSDKEEESQPLTNLPIPSQVVRPGDHQFAACNRDDLSWGYIHKVDDNQFHYHGRLRGLDQATFDALCRPFNGSGSGPWSNQSRVGKAYAIHLDYVPLQTNSYYSSESWGEFLPDPAGDNMFRAGPTIYDLREKADLTNDERLKKTHDLVTQHFRYRQFEKPESVPGVAKGKMKESQAEELAELGLDDPRVQAHLLKFIEEKEDVKATQAKSLPRKVSRGFLFFQPTYEVDYEITKPASTIHSTMAVLAFSNVSNTVNDSRPLFLLVASCDQGGRKTTIAQNCGSAMPAAEAHERLKQILEENSIQASSPFTRLNFDQSVWFLNDAVPNLVLGKLVADLAENHTSIDTAVARCDLNELKVVTDADSLRIRAKHLEGSGDQRARKSIEFAIPTLGKHSEWTAVSDQQFLPAMASFLSCQAAPASWLDAHALWVSPGADPAGLDAGRLLFHSEEDSVDERMTIKVIQRQQAPYQFSIDRSDLYAVLQGYGRAPWNQASISQFLRTKTDLADKDFRFFVNRFESAEITHISTRASDTITIEVREIDPQTRVIMKKEPIGTAIVASAQAEQCASSLLDQSNIGVDKKGPLATFFTLSEPRNQTGLGVVQFVQALAALDQNDAPNCAFPGRLDTDQNNN